MRLTLADSGNRGGAVAGVAAAACVGKCAVLSFSHAVTAFGGNFLLPVASSATVAWTLAGVGVLAGVPRAKRFFCRGSHGLGALYTLCLAGLLVSQSGLSLERSRHQVGKGAADNTAVPADPMCSLQSFVKAQAGHLSPGNSRGTSIKNSAWDTHATLHAMSLVSAAGIVAFAIRDSRKLGGGSQPR